MVAGIESNPLQLDPRYSTDANSVRIGNLIYNALLRYNERSQLRSELAEQWRMLDDRTYLFELRKNVFFHDGAPLTAEHSWPLRLVVPSRYFWKSAKWLRAIELVPDDRPGYWERYGYHNDADPAREERYSF